MITLAQVNAESMATPLTEEEQMVIENLVLSSEAYAKASSLYSDLSDLIDAEQLAPTEKTKFLRAVLTMLGTISSFEAESEGSDKDKTYVSTRKNWESLAQDVLNLLYRGVGAALYMSTGFAVVQRRLEGLLIDDESPKVRIIT